MAQPNNYELHLSPEQIAQVDAAIDLLVEIIAPQVKTLTKDERRELPKMGDKTVAFVGKAREYGSQNPHLVPPYVDMAALEADLEGDSLLARFSRRLTPLLQGINDSRMLAGSEAFQAALMIYHSSKMAAAAGVPNAKAVYEDLAVRFPGGGRKPVDPS